ncbi:putative nucleotidyltransferase, ribonuclease H [Tanacetum coccineum]
MVNTRTDAELAAAVQAAVDAMLPQIREQVREEYRAGASGGNPPPATIHTWLERFNKQKPHSFEKAVAPVDAENWISHMEKIFDVMDCNDAFKTRLVVYKFEGDALAWWKAYKQAKGGDAWVLTLTWAAFKELFFLQFFPRAEQERLKREYHSIRQRASENSTEYMQRFLRLAGFLGQAAGMLKSWRSPNVQTEAQSGDVFHLTVSRVGTGVTVRVRRQKRPSRSDRQGGGDFWCWTRPKEQRTAIPPIYQLGFPAGPGVPLEGYNHPVCNTCGRRHPGECRRAVVLASNVARLVIFSGDYKSTSGASSIVFPDELPEYLLIASLSFNIELIPGAEPISKAFIDGTIELKELKDFFTGIVWSGVLFAVGSTWGAPVLFVQSRRRKVEFLGHMFQTRRNHLDSSEGEAITNGQARRMGEVCMDRERDKSFEELKQRLDSALFLLLHLVQTLSSLSKFGRHYLMASRVDIFTDHRALSDILSRSENLSNEDGGVAIVSDRDPVSRLVWKGLQKAWDRLKFSTLYPEDRRTVGAVGERILEGPEMIEVTNEKVAIAREKLKEAQTRQKSYADRHRRALEFQPGEHVFLKVSPTRGVRRFGIKGKLSPRFIGPFEILDRVGKVSYHLALPPQLSHVHNVFHVSLLRGYKYHPLHVISYPFDQIREDLSYTEEPESILDRQDRVMRNKTISFVKILWRNHPEREATWETEESIRTSYPHFLP